MYQHNDGIEFVLVKAIHSNKDRNCRWIVREGKANPLQSKPQIMKEQAWVSHTFLLSIVIFSPSFFFPGIWSVMATKQADIAKASMAFNCLWSYQNPHSLNASFQILLEEVQTGHSLCCNPLRVLSPDLITAQKLNGTQTLTRTQTLVVEVMGGGEEKQRQSSNVAADLFPINNHWRKKILWLLALLFPTACLILILCM